MILKYEPLIKGRGFDPAPVARYGIPSFADSRSDPRVMGTVAHEDYWNEQIDRCVNGYETGSIHIPGRYYYYLNFCILHTLGRNFHYPDFVDIDYEFFDLVDFTKKSGKYKNDPTAGGKGIISIKARRKGVSHKFSEGVFGYGVRFNGGGYKAGVVAGDKKYSKGFYQKFIHSNAKMPPELYLHTLAKNPDEWIAGYQKKAQAGGFEDDGSMNTIFCRTAGMSENVFKGEMLHDCAFEESGEFKNIKACYGATKDCFQVGAMMKGTPYVWGTGGKQSSSREFKEMLADADYYDLVPFNIMGPRMMVGFFMGSVDDNGDLKENCPNIKAQYAHLEPEQIIGCEDVLEAEKAIIIERERLKKARDKQKYFDYVQNMPLNEKDAFLNFSGNPYNPEILSDQIHEILTNPLRYRKVNLEWKRNDKGELLIPLQVEIIPVKPETEDRDCILMLEEPAPNWKDNDIGGIDSYDLDQSLTSKSLGAMVIVRRRDLVTRQAIRRPILLIRQRPARKEIFYDNCLKAAVLYNLIGNTLIDIANGLIFEHFKRAGCAKYLAKRPRSFEKDTSQQQHEHGVKFTYSPDGSGSKNQMVALTQTWIEDDARDCWFPHIISELADYDVLADDSDWDAADALGIALMRISDMGRAPIDRSQEDNSGYADLPVWSTRSDGTIVDLTMPQGKSDSRHDL